MPGLYCIVLYCIFITQRYQRKILSMRTNVVLPVWVPPPEVRPAAGLQGNIYQVRPRLLWRRIRRTYEAIWPGGPASPWRRLKKSICVAGVRSSSFLKPLILVDESIIVHFVNCSIYQSLVLRRICAGLVGNVSFKSLQLSWDHV